MKIHSLIIICFLLLLNISCNNSKSTNFNSNIEELKETQVDSNSHIIPWADEFSLINVDEPTFKIELKKTELEATGWIIANIEGFSMKIVVNDDYHKNNRKGSAIWDGDALQISIDAMGNGVGNKPKETSYVGKDDASITFALTDNGPKIFAHYHGNNKMLGDKSKMNFDISRDGIKQTTTYILNFLWTDFQTKCGISDVFGIAIQVNDTDKGTNQNRIFWDMGASGHISPGLYNICKLEQPNTEFISVLPYKTDIWNSNDVIKIIVAANYKSSFSIDIKENTNTIIKEEIPANNELKLKRYQISYSISDYEKSLEYCIQIKNDTNIITEDKFSSQFPGKSVEKLLIEIKNKTISDSDTLTKQYLNTIYKLVNNTWNDALEDVQQDDNSALLCSQYSQRIHQQIISINNQFEGSITKSERVTLYSFNSSKDSSLQYYKLSYPANYNIETKYPIIVDLHGWGKQYILSFAISQFGTDEDTCCYKNNHEAFIIQPWGRGNKYYKNNAGQDIYDGINDLINTFTIDEDRIYLTGFSMGGFGTWSHALLNPEKWRAIAICAGAKSEDSKFENLPKLKNTPTMIWHGDSDGGVSVENAYEMENLFNEQGNKPYMRIIEGRGHEFRLSDRNEVYKWLLSN